MMPLLMIEDLFIIITGVAALEKQTLTPGVHLGLGPQSSTSPAWLVHTWLPQCQRPVLRSKTAGCDQEGTGPGGQRNPICQQCHSMREAHWTQPTCPTLTSTCTPFTHSLASCQPGAPATAPRPERPPLKPPPNPILSSNQEQVCLQLLASPTEGLSPKTMAHAGPRGVPRHCLPSWPSSPASPSSVFRGPGWTVEHTSTQGPGHPGVQL